MTKKWSWLLILCSITLNADQFSFVLYNDTFARTDKHFTSGLGLSWIDDECGKQDCNQTNGYSSLILDIVNLLPLRITDTSKQHNAGISLSQIMLTPVDKSKTAAQYDDIPYTGYLSLDFYMFEWNNEDFSEFRMEFGVVGEESGAKFLQNNVHRILNNDLSLGWDTQIGTKYTVNALFRYGEKSWEDYNSGFHMDWLNHFGIQAGNFISDLFGGTMFRVGNNYIRNFNVHYPYLKEEASLLRIDKKHDGFGWSFSTGINAELLAYSYVFDEAKKEGYTIESNMAHLSIYTGVDLYYEAHKLTFFFQSQSPDIKQENAIDSCGGFKYSFQF